MQRIGFQPKLNRANDDFSQCTENLSGSEEGRSQTEDHSDENQGVEGSNARPGHENRQVAETGAVVRLHQRLDVFVGWAKVDRS